MLVTHTGIEFNYLNPTKEMVNIEDIIQSLPRLNRFVGHSKRPYSVGEHLLHCFVMAKELGYTEREQLLTFIHDFTEAYVGDCPAPLKNLIPDFSEIESQVEKAIYEHIGIEPPTEEEHYKIKRVDLTMLVLEMRDLTEHKWENFINDYTYSEVLENDYFTLDTEPVSEDRVRKTLKEVYNHLISKVKEDDAHDHE